jgi:hypothetical protein
MAFPVMAVLAAVQAAGGIYSAIKGKKGQRAVDPEVLKKLFGPEAITEEALQMFNATINSPAGQQMMTNAAQSGQSFSNQMQAELGKAGFTGEGSGSPLASFTSAASREAGNSMQRQVRSDMYGNALNAAQQNVGQRMGVWAGSQQIQQQQPSFGTQLGSALLGGAATAASMIPGKQAAVTPPPTTTQSAPAGGIQSFAPSPGYFGQAGYTGSKLGRLKNPRQDYMYDKY